MSNPPLSAAIGAYITTISDILRSAVTRRRPWFELFDLSTISRPSSLSDATVRGRKNLSYFCANYATMLVTVLAFSLLSHPLSLLTLVSLIAAWLLLYIFRPPDQQLVIFNRTISHRDALWILIAFTFSVIFFTSVGSLLMSSTLIGFGIVCVHAVFRDPEDLFLDDTVLANSGLFSVVLNGSAAAPTVVSKV
ncbi:PRA1 family protein B3-like [Olea europaea var. sylvestris]|uniref:PRA1 family protein n=1 Tax=Olea europaea subsp. europaea TaxID=158383 RepID=A0A8S0UGA5_OLEEU|nr:PRA1 family protein B3-like [Olea europaea var. sylvestris]CAA3016752.1 PRA1 family B4-like [Olea europaea subsp. europaea]